MQSSNRRRSLHFVGLHLTSISVDPPYNPLLNEVGPCRSMKPESRHRPEEISSQGTTIFVQTTEMLLLLLPSVSDQT